MKRRVRKPQEMIPSYKIITISMYHEDLLRLDAMVAALKKRGVTNASRSGLIRIALNEVHLDAIKSM